MLIALAGIILGILISSLWIFLPLKRVPETIKIKKSIYIRSIVIGATLCTLIILILETLFDRLTGLDPKETTSLAQAVISSFLRAALIEEAVKFLFVKRALKKHKPADKLQYMLIAGTIGMGYGITEKLALGSAAAILFYSFLALHIMFQFIMGAYLYKADHAADAGQKKSFLLQAYFIPFILHGAWDTVLSVPSVFFASDSLNIAGVIAIVIVIIAIIGAVIGEIRMMKYLKKV